MIGEFSLSVAGFVAKLPRKSLSFGSSPDGRHACRRSVGVALDLVALARFGDRRHALSILSGLTNM